MGKNAPFVVLAIASVIFLIGPIIFGALVAFSFAGMGGSTTSGGSSGGGGTISCENSNFKVKESGEIIKEPNHPPADKKYKIGSAKDYIPIYQAAAAHYKLGPDGPSYLSAIHKIETGYSSNETFSSAGAIGDMQFMPATWDSQAVDVNDGKRNAWDVEDAIFGAAHYLNTSGAPGDWAGAVFSYNNSPAYVDEVTADAESFKIEACK